MCHARHCVLGLCGHGAAVRTGPGRRAWRGGTPRAEGPRGCPDDPAAAAARGPAESILTVAEAGSVCSMTFGHLPHWPAVLARGATPRNPREPAQAAR